MPQPTSSSKTSNKRQYSELDSDNRDEKNANSPKTPKVEPKASKPRNGQKVKHLSCWRCIILEKPVGERQYAYPKSHSCFSSATIKRRVEIVWRMTQRGTWNVNCAAIEKHVVSVGEMARPGDWDVDEKIWQIR